MKILYCITSLAHKRVFQSFVERNGINQFLIGPKTIIFDGIVPEDYSEIKIQNRLEYKDVSEIQKIVNDFCPNYYLHADLSPIQKKIRLPSGCKRIYVSHGLIPKYAKNILKSLGNVGGVWGGCDLYCGGTKTFKEWINNVAKENDKKILLNAVPQFDVLHEFKNNMPKEIRTNILKHTKNPNADKILFFGGFCCKDRADFLDHNEDYFRSCIELERLAKKNNWLVFIKPRQTYVDMRNFLSTHKYDWGRWTQKYLKNYADIQNSKHLHFIGTSCGIHYYYFISDLMLINGCSTIEVEAHSIEKPIIVINTKSKPDAFDTFDAAHRVENFDDLENTIIDIFNNPTQKCEKQRNMISQIGLTFDGKMHERIIKKIMQM